MGVSSIDSVICGCCVLAGGLRPTPLCAASGMSTLDLGVGRGRVLFDALRDRLGESDALASAPVFVLAGRWVPRPAGGVLAERGAKLVVELDGYRGPTGTIRDAAAAHGLRGTLLVLEANRHYASGLGAFVEAHRRSGAAVTVAATSDGRPGGAYLIETRVLAQAPRRGFMDLKEQFLGRVLASGERIGVHRLEVGATRAVRTLADLLEVARAESGLRAMRGEAVEYGRLRLVGTEEESVDSFPGAHVVDSIVMPGAEVGEGAVVTRSLLLPGARVAPGEMVVDEVRRASAAGSRGRAGKAGWAGKGSAGRFGREAGRASPRRGRVAEAVPA